MAPPRRLELSLSHIHINKALRKGGFSEYNKARVNPNKEGKTPKRLLLDTNTSFELDLINLTWSTWAGLCWSEGGGVTRIPWNMTGVRQWIRAGTGRPRTTLTSFPGQQTLSPGGHRVADAQACRTKRRWVGQLLALHWSGGCKFSPAPLPPAQLRVLRRKVFISSLKSS